MTWVHIEGSTKIGAVNATTNFALLTELIGSTGNAVKATTNGALLTELIGSTGNAVKATTNGALLTELIGSTGNAVKATTDGALLVGLVGSTGTAVKATSDGALAVSIIGSLGREAIFTNQVVTNGSYVLSALRVPSANEFDYAIDFTASVKWILYLIPQDSSGSGQLGAAYTLIDKSTAAAENLYTTSATRVAWPAYKMQITNSQGADITCSELYEIKHFGR